MSRRSQVKQRRRSIVRQLARTMAPVSLIDAGIDDDIEDFDPQVVCLDDKCNSYCIPISVDQVPDSMTCADCGSDLYEYNEEDDDADVPTDLYEGIINREVQLSRAHAHHDMDNSDRQRLTQMVTTANPTATTQHSDTFTCPPDLTGCPIAHRATVYLPLRLVNECVFLCEKFDTEWIAYLLGFARPNEPDSYEVTGMYFPRQHANGVHVDAEEGEIRPGTIAAIHSHVSMSVTPSGEDERHRNHAVELIINRRGEISANGRVTLGCGRFHRGDAIVKFIGTEHEEELRQQLSEVLVQERWQSGVGSGAQSNAGHRYNWLPQMPGQTAPVTHVASPQASAAKAAGSDFNVNGSGKGHGGSVGN